jgi:hypothetical protein
MALPVDVVPGVAARCGMTGLRRPLGDDYQDEPEDQPGLSAERTRSRTQS